MVIYYDPEFGAPPAVPDDEKESGTEIDVNVAAELPAGHRITAVTTHGASFWARTSRLDAQLQDGTEKAYFLKVTTGETGREMARGEYESTKALYSVIPTNIPYPISWGTYASQPDKHFYLGNFCDMEDELPIVSDFVSVVAQMHQDSISPTGKFGFHTTTFGGNRPVDNAWCDTWEEFFIRAMRVMVQHEIAVQGDSEELNDLTEKVCTKVIPRLLRPLESGGRSIKPSLVHGDLYHGNVAIDGLTDTPIFFDPCAVYAHNEFEMGYWRASRFRINRGHVRAYHKLVEISKPGEDHDDRNALYALRIDLLISALFPSNKRTRQLAMQEMKRLVEKFPDGIEGYHE